MRFVFFILIFLTTIFADSFELTQKEKAWIKNNIVKIGIIDLYPLSYLNKDYQRDGFANDILELIIKKYQIKTRTVDINQGNIDFAFENGEVDLVPIVNSVQIQSSYGVYSSEILKIKKILFVKKEQNKINSFEDLNNKKIAVVKDNETITNIRKKDLFIEIVETKNMQESVQKLLEGTVDGIIAAPVIIQKYLAQNLIIDLKAVPSITFAPSNLYFFSNREKPILQSIIDKGLNSITVKEEKELFDKWFLRDLADLPIIFTKKELNYIQNKESLNLCVDPDWMPYEKIENHKHVGIIADYMKEFQEKIGIPFKLIETKDWTQSLEYMKERKCDVLSFVMNLESRQHYMSFTKPFLNPPIVLVTKRNINFITDLKDLRNKKIGIQKNFASSEIIRKNYPNLEIVEVPHLRDGLEKVERGQLFGQVTTHLNVAYAFQEEFYGSLQISGKFDEQWHLGVGVRNDEPILLDIFEKVVNSISDETRQRIINNWVLTKYEKSIDYKLFWSIFSFLIFIILLILYIYFIQRRYIRKITKAKEEIENLNSTLERKVQLRTRELELSNKELKFKTQELEYLNNTLDTRIKEEINKRKKQEQLLIQQSKLAEMGEMISMIAHQWRQPLSALGTIIQNIHLRYSLDKLDKEYLENQRILSNALTDKMSKTIDDFRNFFKPSKEKHYFSIKDVINQTIFLIDDSFKSHSIKIETKILDDVKIYGFENELSQVLLNILTNARDAFIENNIEEPLIVIKTKLIHTHIQILISDNAGGINKSIFHKIFEPYFTTKDSYNGTGLGLYMSKIIIEQSMLGQLSVKNIDNGVEFCMYIPINYKG
ncbi:MAG: transporter substrate-binding domain-containing protein [Arcobacter sp.]|uniref:transporter substrate-binding domain-containing protein n=1 Tax=Arcobacter sp. TaxID=1872629 RepID=UPI002A75BEF2|nr:transporter substrate-binding domain-containing protein [Arcobacter sp.]MDY3199704.1 transporter substrate-binding domain-containing protein [Arcobacter sp.]